MKAYIQAMSMSRSNLCDWIEDHTYYKIYQNKMSSTLKYVIDKESEYNTISSIDDERFRLIVEDYFLWLANYLSQTELLDKDDVLEELDRLGLTETYGG